MVGVEIFLGCSQFSIILVMSSVVPGTTVMVEVETFLGYPLGTSWDNYKAWDYSSGWSGDNPGILQQLIPGTKGVETS